MAYVLVKADDKDDAATRNIANIKEDPRDKKRPVQVVRPEGGKSTTNIEGSGFTAPKKGVNPAIMSPIDLTEDQLSDILARINTDEYRQQNSASRQAELDKLISQAKTEGETEGEGESEPASKFMAGTDLRTSEGVVNQFKDRAQNIPGYLDMVFDLAGVDKTLAYDKMGRMNLSLEDIFDQLQNNELPTHRSGQEAADEGKQMRSARAEAVGEISQGADVEEAGTATGRKDRPIGNVFAQTGGTRDLTPDEEEEVRQAMVGVKIGEGEKKLAEIGVKRTPQGKYVKIQRPSVFGQEGDDPSAKVDYEQAERGFGGIDTNIDDKGRNQLAQRVAVTERMDKLEDLKEQRQRLKDKMSGQIMLPANRDGVNFKDIEDIRVGAQDELEDIKEGRVKFPEHLRSLESYAASKGIRPPRPMPKLNELISDAAAEDIKLRRSAVRAGDTETFTDRSGKVKVAPSKIDDRKMPTGQDFTETMFTDESLRDSVKEGKLTPSEKNKLHSTHVAAALKYQKQMADLKEKYDQERREHIISSGVDKPKEIQGRIPKLLEEQGLSDLPSPGAEFGMRTNREGKVTRDMGEGQNVRHHIQTMLENDEVNGPWWQRKASELGFDLSQDEDFVASQAALGVEVGSSQFPSIAGGNVLSDPKMDASYGDGVIRKPKKFSADQPVGQEEATDDEDAMKLRSRSHKAAMSAIAKFLQSHFAEIGTEEANKHMPGYAQIADRKFSGNDMADMMSQMDQIDSQIAREEGNRAATQQADEELDIESMAAQMGRQHADRVANQQKAVDRAIESVAPYYVPTQAQSKFMQETTSALADRPGEDAKQVIGDFSAEERERLLQPLKEAVAYFTPLLQDMQNDPDKGNLQIPTTGGNRLHDVSQVRPDERGNLKVVQNMDKLQAQIDAAEAMGNEEAAKKLKNQLMHLEQQEVIDANKPHDYFTEQYEVPITDSRTDKTKYVTRERPSTHSTGRDMKKLGADEIAEHIIFMLMDDMQQAAKEGRYNIIDSFATDFKSENEQLYRNLGHRKIIDSFKDMSAFDQRAANLKREIDSAQREAMEAAGRSPSGNFPALATRERSGSTPEGDGSPNLGPLQSTGKIKEIAPLEPGMEEVMRGPDYPQLRQLMGLPPTKKPADVKEADIRSQIPEKTGLGVSPAVGLAAPLNANEKRIARANQAKEEAEHQKRIAGKENMVQVLNRDRINEDKARAGKQIADDVRSKREAGAPPLYPLANVSLASSPFAGAEPAAPAVAQPMPEQPAPPVEQPMPVEQTGQPEQPAPPVEQPMPEQTGSPFAQDLSFNQPPTTTTTDSGIPLTAEQAQHLMQLQNDPNNTMTFEEMMYEVRKSTPIKSFNATKGDELLKGIKDKFWRQGY